MRQGWSRLFPILISCSCLALIGCDAELEQGEEERPAAVEPIGEEQAGVIRVLAKKTGKAPDEISIRQTLEQLGVDDLGLVGVLSELEDRYGIAIKDESIELATGTKGEQRPATPHLTVGRLVTLVKRARGAP